MKRFVLSTIFAALAAPAVADISAESQSGALSHSSSGVIVEGSESTGIAPSMPAPGNMHTAPCVIGRSVGVSVVGFGFSAGGGRIDGNCNTREEAEFLFEVISQRAGPAKQAAIYHMCATDESLRNTLVGMGLCAPRGSAAATASTREPEASPRVLYRSCAMEENGPVVRVRSGLTEAQVAQAQAQCASALGM